MITLNFDLIHTLSIIVDFGRKIIEPMAIQVISMMSHIGVGTGGARGACAPPNILGGRAWPTQ